MDLKQLKTFTVLSKIKNYTKTAVELGYAQSSISAQIQQLEQELNTKLFDRIGKNIFLTASGEMFLSYATEMLALSENVKDKLACDQMSQGQLIIGASESLCVFQLPEIIKSFMNTHPHIEVHLKLLDTDQAVEQLTDNTIDIAFTIGNPVAHPSIVTFVKNAEDILVLSAPTHPLASYSTLDVADFTEQTFIVTGAGCNYRTAFEYDLRSNGIPYRIALEAASVQAIKEMAMSGLGLCVLPRLAVRKELSENLLSALPYENDYKIYVQLFCHNSKWISPYLSDFIELVNESCSRFAHVERQNNIESY
jgi:DNA-binding transcriptional LysR family regulator